MRGQYSGVIYQQLIYKKKQQRTEATMLSDSG